MDCFPLGAARNNHVDVVQALLLAGVTLLIYYYYSGAWTALHKAASKGSVEVVQVLLAAGARLDDKDEDERIPLQWAAANYHMNVVQALLAAGEDAVEKCPLLCFKLLKTAT